MRVGVRMLERAGFGVVDGVGVGSWSGKGLGTRLVMGVCGALGGGGEGAYGWGWGYGLVLGYTRQKNDAVFTSSVVENITKKGPPGRYIS